MNTRGGTLMGIRLLGQIEADDGAPLALAGPTQRRVLAVLALRRNEVVSVDQLVEAVWPDTDPPKKAAHNVRTYVHRLRTSLGSLGDKVETAGGGYLLRLDSGELDTARFEELAANATRLAKTGETIAALDIIDQAQALWRGEPLEEFGDDLWAQPDVVRLRTTAADMRTTQARLLLLAGRPNEAERVLESLIRAEPLREEPRALMMRALYESGRHVDALRAFQEFRTYLIDEIGVEPSTSLVELDRAISIDKVTSLGSAPTIVGAYELHERIGEGAFAVVHRATQTSLAREVAVKIVRAELANQPEFIRRFEAEAQMVAGIEHPNVVPLYDFWREPDQAFLIMRWMTGGSLEQRLDEGTCSIEQTVGLVESIAGALDAAHASGVVHRDVKPGNILFDGDARPSLADFGIALAADERSHPEAALSEGSPIFAAPEQLRGQPVGPEADVHSLGIVAYTMLTGRTPFADTLDEPTMLQRQLNEAIPSVLESVPGLPPTIDNVLAIATAKLPADRYPTAGGFATALSAAALGAADDGSTTARTVLRPRANPYKGLRAFDESDAEDFFGRDRLVDELLSRLGRSDRQFLAVVGPSGSGKSSVVRAGLLPALRRGALPGSANWFTTTMVPGGRPFEALETALLRIAVNPPGSLLEQLSDGDRGILRSVKRILPDDNASVTIVIDQFEELFTGTGDDERDQFLRAIAVAAADPAAAVRFVITLRADFYDRPLRHPEFAPLLKDHAVVVTPLAADEVRQAITSPAAAVGVEFEPGLVAQIVADVHNEPGALPLLQFALGRLFDSSNNHDAANLITIDTYAAIGGVTGAISTRAEELFQAFGVAEQTAARRLFGRLVSLGEGTEDTRRRVLKSELGDDDATQLVIDRFAEARLLTFDRQALSREPTVEVAHEALIREWPRLQAWLEEDRDDLRAHRHLTTAAGGWNNQNRDQAELYRGGRLEGAESLEVSGNVTLNEMESDFVRASAAARDQQREREQQSVRRLKRLVAAVAVIAALAITASVLAVVQRNRADEVALQADVERMAAIARQSDPLDPTAAILLAVEAHRADPSDATLDALHRALTGRQAYLGQLASEQVWNITALDDGVRVVANTASSIDIWNVESRTLEASWPIDIGQGIGGQLAPINVDGRLIYLTAPYFSSAAKDGSVAAMSADANVQVVDLASGELIGAVDLPAPVSAMAVSNDGSRIAIGSLDGTVQLFSLDDLASPLWVSQHDSHPTDLEWSPDGQNLASGHGSGEISMYALDDPDPVWTFDGYEEWTSPASDARGLLFSADGGRLIVERQEQELITRTSDVRNAELVTDTSGYGQVIQEFDPATGEPVTEPMPVFGDEITLRWADPTETSVLSGGIRSNLVVYDLDGNREPRSLTDEGRGDGGSMVALLDLDVAVTAGRTGMSLHSIRGSDAVSTLIPLSARQELGDPNALRMMAFDDDTSMVATGVFDFQPPSQQAEIFDLDDPSSESMVMAEFVDAEIPNLAIGFGPSVMMVSFAGTSIRPGLDGAPYGPTRPIIGDGSGQAAASPNGEREISWAGGANGALLLSDTATGELVADLTGLVGDDITWLHFSTDSSRLDIYSGRSGYVFDGVTGELLWAREETGAIISGPGGEYYAVTDGEATIQLLDQTTREPVGDPYIGHAAEIFNLDFNTDASLISSRSADGTVRVWGTDSRRQLGGEVDAFAANGVVKWSPDGTKMAYPEQRGMRVWNFDTTSWADIACEVAGRNLTEAEWSEFGPRTVDYRPTCEQYDLAPG